MADEELDGTNVVLDLLREGQGVADEAGETLSQGVVEALDMIGLPRFFRDGLVALSRDDALVHFILVRVKSGVFMINLRNLSPQGVGVFTAPIAHVKRNDLARSGVHGQPNPLFVGLFLNEAPHFVAFSLQFVDQYFIDTGRKPHI